MLRDHWGWGLLPWSPFCPSKHLGCIAGADVLGQDSKQGGQGEGSLLGLLSLQAWAAQSTLSPWRVLVHVASAQLFSSGASVSPSAGSLPCCPLPLYSEPLLGAPGARSHGLSRHRDPGVQAGPAGGGGQAALPCPLPVGLVLPATLLAPGPLL